MHWIVQHRGIFKLMVLAAVLLYSAGLKYFRKRKRRALEAQGVQPDNFASAIPAAAANTPAPKGPIILTFDVWQALPILITFALGFAVILYADTVIGRLALQGRLHGSSADEMVVVLGVANLIIGACFGWMLYKTVSPDRVTLTADTLEITSLGRTRQWRWSEIRNLDMKSFQSAQTGRVRSVRFDVPGGETISVPRFLKSGEGPEDEPTVLALMQGFVARARARRNFQSPGNFSVAAE